MPNPHFRREDEEKGRRSRKKERGREING